MVWKILSWLNKPRGSQPSKHIVEIGSQAESLAHVDLDSPKSQNDSRGQCQLSGTEGVAQSMPLPDSNPQVMDRHLSDFLRFDRLHHETAATKTAMAYWRRNTRREQPEDKVVYDQFTSSGYNWPTVGLETTTKPRQTGEHSSPDLSALLVKNTKDGMYGLYAHKVQSELEKRFDDRSHALPISQEDASANFPGLTPTPGRPGYLDDYFFAPAEPEQQEMLQQEMLQQEMPGSLVKAKLSSWEEPEQDQLRETLHSIAFSPECEEAVASSHEYEEALDPPADESQVDSQRDTLDRLPYAQFVDVRIAVADHPDTSIGVLAELAEDESPDVRFAIAENHNVGREILFKLTEDENPYVAHRARITLQRLDGGKMIPGAFAKTGNSQGLVKQAGSRK